VVEAGLVKLSTGEESLIVSVMAFGSQKAPDRLSRADPQNRFIFNCGRY